MAFQKVNSKKQVQKVLDFTEAAKAGIIEPDQILVVNELRITTYGVEIFCMTEGNIIKAFCSNKFKSQYSIWSEIFDQVESDYPKFATTDCFAVAFDGQFKNGYAGIDIYRDEDTPYYWEKKLLPSGQEQVTGSLQLPPTTGKKSRKSTKPFSMSASNSPE